MCMMCNCSSKWRGTILYIFVSICGDGMFVILLVFFPAALRCGQSPNVPLIITDHKRLPNQATRNGSEFA